MHYFGEKLVRAKAALLDCGESHVKIKHHRTA